MHRSVGAAVIRRLILENVMSHGRTELELSDGLTVLVGPNNCGKSAVVEALRILCENSGGEFVVRHGADSARILVEVQNDDGPHTLEWRRDGSTTSYVIDGRPVHRLRRGAVPDDLHSILRLAPVAGPNGQEFAVHFGAQKEPLFLLDRSGQDAARFFSAGNDAVRLMAMQRAHAEKERDAKRRDKELAAQTAALTKTLDALADLPALEAAADAVEQTYDALQKQAAALAAAEQTLADLRHRQHAIAALLDRDRVLAELPSPPALADVAPLAQLADRLRHALAQADLEHARQRAIATLPTPPVLHDTAPLEALGRTLAGQRRAVALWEDRCAVIAALATPPSLSDAAALETQVRELSAHSAAFAIAQARAQALADLPQAPALADPGPLAQATVALAEAQATVTKRQLELQETQAALAAGTDDVRAYLADHPVCPTCGTTIDPDRLMAATGTHGGHAHA